MIGAGETEAWRVTVKAGFDSMPAARREALELLIIRDDAATTTEVATELGLPTQTTRRVLEDLAAHEVLVRQSQGEESLTCGVRTRGRSSSGVRQPFPKSRRTRTETRYRGSVPTFRERLESRCVAG